MKRFEQHILPVLLIGFVTLLVFRVPLLTGTMPLHTDGQFMTFPAFAYFKRWALKGFFPVWWITDTVCGNMADTASAGPAWQLFTPLYLYLRLESAWFLALVLQFFLSGLLMYLYLTQMTKHSLVSLYGALLYMRSEWVVETLVEPQMELFLFPLILFFIERAIQTSKMRHIFSAAFFLILFFLGANVSYPLYLIPATFLYFFIRTTQKVRSSPRSDNRLYLYGVVLILLFAAWSWFRPYMLSIAGSQSTRETLENSKPLFTDPVSLLSAIFPDLFTGNTVQSPYIYDRIREGLSHLILGHSILLRPLSIWYPGLFAIFFVFYAWSYRRNTPWAFSYWLVFYGFLFYVTMGEALFFPIMRKISLFNMITNTQRISVLSTVTLPILATCGFQACIRTFDLEKTNRTLWNQWYIRFLLFFSVVLIVFLTKDTVVFAIDRFWKKSLVNRIFEFVHAHPTVYQQPEIFYQTRINEFFAWLSSWGSWRSCALLLPLILFVAGGFIYKLWKTGKLSSVAAGICFFSIVIWDGFIFHPLPLNTLVSRLHAYPPNPTISFLLQDHSLFRILSLKPAGEPPFREARTQFLPADKQLVYGLASIHGYQAVLYKRYAEIFQILSLSPTMETIRLQDIYQYEKKIIDLLNVKYIVVKRPGVIPNETPIFKDSLYRVYQNRNVFPRAFLTPESIGVRDQRESLDEIKGGKIDFRKTALLEGGNAPVIKSNKLTQADQVEVKNYSPHKIALEVYASAERILVLTDSFHPSWKCFMDGERTPIYIADHAFRGVLVKPGNHYIRFELEPFSYRFYTIGILAATGFACAASLHYRRKKKKSLS